MVYLIHLDQKLAHAGHYLGFCEDNDPARRIARHKAGNGSRLLRAANAAGIDYAVVRVWQDADRNFERKLKNRKNTPQLCPICGQGE